MGLCKPRAKLKGETCRPSRRADQPSVQLCAIYPAFHPGNICAVSSISFYAADVKTWLPINSLQLSSHTRAASRYSTLSCNLLLPSFCCSPPITKPKNLGFGLGFLVCVVFFFSSCLPAFHLLSHHKVKASKKQALLCVVSMTSVRSRKAKSLVKARQSTYTSVFFCTAEGFAGLD